MASPALNILNNTSKSMTGGVKGLKYTDLQNVLETIIQLREEAEMTQKFLKDVIKDNQRISNGGLDTFALSIHDAKLKQKLEIEIRQKLGLNL